MVLFDVWKKKEEPGKLEKLFSHIHVFFFWQIFGEINVKKKMSYFPSFPTNKTMLIWKYLLLISIFLNFLADPNTSIYVHHNVICDNSACAL